MYVPIYSYLYWPLKEIFLVFLNVGAILENFYSFIEEASVKLFNFSH